MRVDDGFDAVGVDGLETEIGLFSYAGAGTGIGIGSGGCFFGRRVCIGLIVVFVAVVVEDRGRDCTLVEGLAPGVGETPRNST